MKHNDIKHCTKTFLNVLSNLNCEQSVTWYEPLNLWHDDNSLLSMMIIKPFQHTCASAHDSWADQRNSGQCVHEHKSTWKSHSIVLHLATTTMCSPPYTITMCSTLHPYHALQLTLLPMNPQMASSVRWSAIRCWFICRFSWQQHKIESNLLWTSKCTTTD